MKAFLLGLPLALSQYCPAGNTVTGDSNLGRVLFTGGLEQTITDDTNCPGVTGIRDLTALVASVSAGRPYSLNFQATTCDSGWARYAYAFIDWNANGLFEPEELLGQQAVDNRVAPVDITFNGTAPSSFAVFGLTRMRVFVVESGNNANPCLSFSYGGVKEFSINLIPSVAPTPSRYCNAGNTVSGGSNLGPVGFLGELHTVIADQTDCPGTTGLRDFTNLSSSVMPGGTYVLELDATTCNGKGYNRLAYAFIDFNSNGVYDADELVGKASVVKKEGASTSPIDVSLRVTIPCSAKPGVTRMRVFVVEGGHTTDPCLVFAYGGVKEFSIVVLKQLQQPCLPPLHYCRTGNLLTGDSNLGAVEIDGVQGSSIHDLSNCPNTPGIKNLTGLSVMLQPGGTYNLFVNVTTCGLGWNRLAYAYIDFNANSEFEPSELLGMSQVNDIKLQVQAKFSFVLPCIGNGSLATVTRMRVFVVEGGVTPDPCARFNYGSVKEFSVQIVDKAVGLCSDSGVLKKMAPRGFHVELE